MQHEQLIFRITCDSPFIQDWQEYLDYHLSPEPVPAPSTSTPIPPLLYRDSK
jgi:hypothetical protein